MFPQTDTAIGTKSGSSPQLTATDVLTGDLSATVGSSSSLSSPAVTSSSLEPPPQYQYFLITFSGPPLLNQGAPALAGRQAVEQYYIKHTGLATLDCRDSAVFSLDPEGQLFGDQNLITTQPGVKFQLFIPPVPNGNISRAWEDLYGVLQWRNPEFLNRVAPMCVQNGLVFLYFLIDPPIDCFPISPRRIPREYLPDENGLEKSTYLT